jgi:hypothetical protein
MQDPGVSTFTTAHQGEIDSFMGMLNICLTGIALIGAKLAERSENASFVTIAMSG